MGLNESVQWDIVHKNLCKTKILTRDKGDSIALILQLIEGKGFVLW